jgi:hypothetical protein
VVEDILMMVTVARWLGDSDNKISQLNI